MQVHAVMTFSCIVAAPTSFVCCNARLDTSVLSFLCLHSKYIAKFVSSNEIIEVTIRKTSTMKLLKKKFLLGKFLSELSCPSVKSKIYFLQLYWWIKFFNVFGASVVLSQMCFGDIGKVCFKVVLFFRMEPLIVSVTLSIWYRSLTKAIFTMKYITNFEFVSWHAAKDSKRKLFFASMLQLHNTLLFTSTYGWLGILTGIL